MQSLKNWDPQSSSLKKSPADTKWVNKHSVHYNFIDNLLRISSELPYRFMCFSFMELLIFNHAFDLYDAHVLDLLVDSKLL